MFRRKEDSLFDSNTDLMEMEESATVISSPSSSSSQASSSPTPAYLNSPSSPAARAPEAPRPASAAPSANSFRPAPSSQPASQTSDLTRNRMPEAKPQASPTPASPASAFTPTPSSSFVGMSSSSKGAKRVLTVGNDILLKGEIATCDRLVIEGKVDATLNDVHTVEIAETGSFKGAAHIEDAEISGLFEGDLIVRNRLVIYATGKVRGRISYGEIEIERGGELTGEIKTTNPGSQGASARPSRAKEEKAAA